MKTKMNKHSKSERELGRKMREYMDYSEQYGIDIYVIDPITETRYPIYEKFNNTAEVYDYCYKNHIPMDMVKMSHFVSDYYGG